MQYELPALRPWPPPPAPTPPAPAPLCQHSSRLPAERAHKGQYMVTEATEVSADGHGYPNTPGIYTGVQMAAWKPIVKAVKGKGTVFFCQLWHCGRASHSAYQEGGARLPLLDNLICLVALGHCGRALHSAYQAGGPHLPWLRRVLCKHALRQHSY
jgi:NADH:flavin oxidoreductase / NADH oxidase family